MIELATQEIVNQRKSMSLLLMILTFVILLLLTLVLKKSLLFSAATALLFATVLHSVVYGFSYLDLLPVIKHGLLTAMEISLLIFGALAFFYFLKSRGFIEKLEQDINKFSGNKLIITIMLVLFFGSFIEGVSGFGTPAMIVAPLLLALGFPPYMAAALPLLANTVPVIFGAVGTPVKISFAGLPVGFVPVYASALMFLPVMALPFFIRKLLMHSNAYVQKEFSVKTNWICFSAGLSFALPFVLLSFAGPEFPTILAAFAGVFLWLLFIRCNKPVRSSIDIATLLPFMQTFKHYLFVAALLLAGKLLLLNNGFFVEWQAIRFQKRIALFQPGLFFIAAIMVLSFLTKERPPVSIKVIFKQTVRKLPKVFGAILCLAILAKLLSQHLAITNLFNATSTVPVFAFYSTAMATGFAGSFMAGSATVSNLIFGAQWYQSGLYGQLPISLLLACQLAGAAIGNALSLQNIAMVQAVVTESGLEKTVMKNLWKPVLLMLLLVAGAAVIMDRLVH